jgi:hypothetical protein
MWRVVEMLTVDLSEVADPDVLRDALAALQRLA